MTDQRITNGPTAIGELVDVAALRRSFAELAAEISRREAEEKAAREAAWAALSIEEKRARRQGFLAQLGVDEDVALDAGFYGFGSSQVERTEATTVVARWTAEQPDSTFLGLVGYVGTGKTYAAARWVLWACGQPGVVPTRDIVWVHARRDLQDLDALGDGKALLRRWASARYLVLDDLGAEYIDAGGVMLTKLEGLLAPRYSRARKTLITSNVLEKSERWRRYGARIMDRIGDRSWVVLQEKRSRR